VARGAIPRHTRRNDPGGPAAMTKLTRRALAGLAPLALRPATAQPAWPERPITLLHGFPPGGGADTVSRLIAAPLGARLGLPAMARAEPGRIAYASGGVGSSHHLTGEALCAAAGVQMTHVPYRGDAAGLTAVLAGEVPLMVSTTVGAIGQLQGGTALRAL